MTGLTPDHLVDQRREGAGCDLAMLLEHAWVQLAKRSLSRIR